MKKLILLLFIPLLSFSQIDSGWTNDEISNADVAREINDISDFEKDIILYHNLVRLYPKKYLKLEILNWREDIYPKDTLKFDFIWDETNLNSNYYKSLIKTLKKKNKLLSLIILLIQIEVTLGLHLKIHYYQTLFIMKIDKKILLNFFCLLKFSAY